MSAAPLLMLTLLTLPSMQSAAELMVSLAHGGHAMSQAVEPIRVEAARGWNDTALEVRAGDILNFDAHGSARLSSDPSDTATPAGSNTGRRAANAPMMTAPAGALIARIGDSVAMLIGAHKMLTAPVSGRLYLSVNDDYMGDNSGEFLVNIAIRSR